MAQKKLENILQKYENNPIIVGKISDFIENQLPRYIQSFIDKKERLKTLEHKMQEYINAFYSSPDTQYFIYQSQILSFITLEIHFNPLLKIKSGITFLPISLQKILF